MTYRLEQDEEFKHVCLLCRWWFRTARGLWQHRDRAHPNMSGDLVDEARNRRRRDRERRQRLRGTQ